MDQRWGDGEEEQQRIRVMEIHMKLRKEGGASGIDFLSYFITLGSCLCRFPAAGTWV